MRAGQHGAGVGCRVSARCEIRKRAAGLLRAGGKETPRCSSAMKAWVVFVFSSSFFFSFFLNSSIRNKQLVVNGAGFFFPNSGRLRGDVLRLGSRGLYEIVGLCCESCLSWRWTPEELFLL